MNENKWKTIKENFSAILDLPENERAEFLGRETDDEIRLEVEKLLAANEKVEGFIDKPILIEQGIAGDPAKDTFIGKQIENYLILERIGTGGMGAVYLAERVNSDFKQKLALKIIKRGMDSEAILKRFAIERKILSTLKHPNIAQLLDGGISSEGLPFFVMELVEGKPLNQFCNESNLSLDARLEIFRQICSAVEHAHQNLIIHRDLKPSNVIVTNDGTPKLLDFGIAKLLSDEDAETTATQAKIFTPEYASPEQILGKNVTTATDVYSLGVIFYELLTQHRPFETKGKSFEEIVKSVCQTEPTAPSLVSDTETQRRRDTENKLQISTNNAASPVRRVSASQLKGDLDNIILKSLRKEPSERYGSVQQLSEDIWRFRNGLPVLARPQTLGYRFGKYVKRHKVGVFAVGVVLLSLISGISIATWQAVVAQRERAKAERRFNDVRKLANTVLFDYNDGIEKLAGSIPIREKMVKDSLEYLDRLSSESDNTNDLQSELATAYQKVGDVQGAPFKANLGDYAGALESYKKSLAIREKLFEKDTNNEKLKIDLGKNYQLVGNVSQLSSDIPAALENYHKAFAIYNLITEKTRESQRNLATLHNRYATSLSASGNLPEAIENNKKGLAITNELIQANPNDNELKRDLGVSNLLLGDTIVKSGDFKQAMEYFRTAKSVFEPLLNAENDQSRRDLGVANERISDTLYKIGDTRGALEIQLKTLKEDEERLKTDQKNATTKRDLAVDYYKVARLQDDLGDFANAFSNQTKSVEISKESVRADPTNSEAQDDLANGYYTLASILENHGKLREALDYYKKTLVMAEERVKSEPENADQLGNLSESQLKVSDLSLKFGDKQTALDGYLKALKINQDLATANPDKLDNQTTLAVNFESLGNYYLLIAKSDNKTENWQNGKDYFQQSLDIWQKVQKSNKLTEEYAKKPDEVKLQLIKCYSALDKLKLN